MCVDTTDIVLSHFNKISPFLSDHNLTEANIRIFLPKIPKKSFSYRKFINITPEAFNEILIQYDWSEYDTNLHLDSAVTTLSKKLQAAINKPAPLIIYLIRI